MSGIGGIWHRDGRPADGGLLRRMMQRVAHRGPDGMSYWLHGPAALGHCLLATTPEARNEHQPLVVGPSVITFDGRLDNRESLAQQLGLAGPSATDPELALRAYLQWGEDAPSHLLGDFAFALWDPSRQQMVCARDHLGIKLLHYYLDADTFIFGSEIKQLFAAAHVPQDLDLVQLGSFLSLEDGAAHGTFYKHVRRLPAGQVLVVSPNRHTERPYWEPGRPVSASQPARQGYVQQFQELFEEAVGSRLRSAGPVGVTVSGGMDSTSVFATARRLAQGEGQAAGKLHSFSWVFPGLPRVDESKYIHAVTGEPGERTHYINGDEHWGLKGSETSPRFLDEPLTAPYEALIQSTFRRARELGVRVMLTGQGGELAEVNLGYLVDLFQGFHWLSLARTLGRLPPRARRAVFRRLGRELAPEWTTRLLGAQVAPSPPWLAPEIAERVSQAQRSAAAAGPHPARRGKHSRDLLQLVDMTRNSGWTVWMDQLGAQFDVEVRHPFWDVRLVEFLTALPPQETFDGRWNKLILRRAMQDALPPAVCWRRDKTRFAALFDRGAVQHESHRLTELAAEPHLGRMGLVDPHIFREHLGRYLEGATEYRDYFWAAFSVEEWLRHREAWITEAATSF